MIAKPIGRTERGKGLVNEAKNDLHFVNVIRFISMIGIVSIHCLIIPGSGDVSEFLHHIPCPAIYIACLNVLRFSVISFCLISGYLMGAKIDNEKVKFYKQRLKVVLIPFLIAFTITTCCFYVRNIIVHKPQKLQEVVSYLVFHTSFWFVPSQLISLLVLLILATRIKQAYLGILLFLMLLCLTVKYVYLQPTHHTSYIFSLAFVFYYWLGTVFKGLKWIDRIKELKLWAILIAWTGSFVVLNFETLVLWKSNYPILNNLSFSNQLYSILSFVLLIKISNCFKSFSIVNPRTESFGIYLYHWLFVAVGHFVVRVTFNLDNLNFLKSIFYSLIYFILTYSMTLALVKLIKNVPFFRLQQRKSRDYYLIKPSHIVKT